MPGGRGDGRAGRPARGTPDPTAALRADPGPRQPGTPSHDQYRQRVCGQPARPAGDSERNASITWRGPFPRCGGRIQACAAVTPKRGPLMRKFHDHWRHRGTRPDRNRGQHRDAGRPQQPARHGRARRSHHPARNRRAQGGRARRAASNSCGFERAIPADDFKGLPNYTAARAAHPFIVRCSPPGPDRLARADVGRAVHDILVPVPGQRGYFTWTHCHRLTLKGIYVLPVTRPVPARARPGTSSKTRT